MGFFTDLLGGPGDVTEMGGGFDPALKPYLEEGLGGLQDAYRAGPRVYRGERVAGFDPAQLQSQASFLALGAGQPDYFNTALAGLQEATDFQRGAARAMTSDEIQQQRELFEPAAERERLASQLAFERSLRDIDVASGSAGAGAMQGSRADILRGGAAGELALAEAGLQSSITERAIAAAEAQRAREVGAASGLASLTGQALGVGQKGFGEQLQRAGVTGQVGSERQALAQKEIGAEMAKFAEADPFSFAQNYLSTIYGAPTRATQYSQEPSTLQEVMGGLTVASSFMSPGANQGGQLKRLSVGSAVAHEEAISSLSAYKDGYGKSMAKHGPTRIKDGEVNLIRIYNNGGGIASLAMGNQPKGRYVSSITPIGYTEEGTPIYDQSQLYKAQAATFVPDDSSSAMAPSPMSTEEKTLAMKKEERDSLLAKQSNTPITPRVGPTKEAAAAMQPPVGGPLRQEQMSMEQKAQQERQEIKQQQLDESATFVKQQEGFDEAKKEFERREAGESDASDGGKGTKLAKNIAAANDMIQTKTFGAADNSQMFAKQSDARQRLAQMLRRNTGGGIASLAEGGMIPVARPVGPEDEVIEEQSTFDKILGGVTSGLRSIGSGVATAGKFYANDIDPFGPAGMNLDKAERIRVGLGILAAQPTLGESPLGTISRGALGALEQTDVVNAQRAKQDAADAKANKIGASDFNAIRKAAAETLEFTYDPDTNTVTDGGEPLTFTQRNALNVLAEEGLDEYSRSGGDYVALQSYLTRRGPELVSTMSLSDITDGGGGTDDTGGGVKVPVVPDPNAQRPSIFGVIGEGLSSMFDSNE